MSIFGHDDPALHGYFDTMTFIPAVEIDERRYLGSGSGGNRSDGNGELRDRDARLRDAVTLFQAWVAVLSPTLTACYTHHVGSAMDDKDGLTKLLRRTVLCGHKGRGRHRSL